MEIAIQNAIYRELLNTQIPTILGPDKIFYRVARGNITPPYLVYHLPGMGMRDHGTYIEDGELIFDVWDYDTMNDRTLAIKDLLVDTFNDSHLQVDGATGVRIYYNTNQEAPIENNRSNRRSENERMFKREVSFDIRGFNQRAAQARIANTNSFSAAFFADNRARYQAITGGLTPAADGVNDTFSLPEAAESLFFVTVNGVATRSFTRIGQSQVQMNTPPAAGAELTARYIPE